MKRLRPLLFIILLGICVVCGLVSSATLLYSPQYARNTFGPPASSLDPFQGLILSLRLNIQQDILLQTGEQPGQVQPFEIYPGETASEIINRLLQEGWIKSGDSFRNYLVYKGYDTLLQPGTYLLDHGSSPVEIANMLVDVKARMVTLRVFAGWRAEEIAQAVTNSGLAISTEEFLSVVNQHPRSLGFELNLPPSARCEGFLFPGLYTFERASTAEDIIAAMLQAFETNLPGEYLDKFANQTLDLYEAVTLASIIQREAVLAEEMPLIASVYLNRLETGMYLQADPTVQYAIGKDHPGETWWKNPLYLKDLEYASPYNTYRNPGLPPGPISNPGMQALDAVAYPAESEFFFFRAACDGSGRHNFSITYDEHLAKACP